MSRYLRWLFRPAILIVVSVALVGAAALVWLQPVAGSGRPQPAGLRPGEHEVAFLYPATSTVWERFVTAVQRSRERLEEFYPGLRCVHDAPAGRGRRTSVPQIALEWPAGPEQESPQRLVFRWYKLTSDWGPEAWVEALLTRRPPPLAIIGGNNSFWAREQAIHLQNIGSELPEERRPLLLLTTATADQVPATDRPAMDLENDGPGREESLVDLHSLYRERTFRFCFTNRQMATAVTRFLWSRPDLRPDSDPAFLTRWEDDAYSRDLDAGYRPVLERRAAENILPQWWSGVSGCVALGVPPAGLGGWYIPGFRNESSYPLFIPSSVGSFATPNPYEAQAVQELLKATEAAQAPWKAVGAPPRRLLLVITGQSAPSRRLLRDLARSAPDTARRFVVAMGDAVAFNTIYRDGLVTWPIQDLPFNLAFFCHRNPIDEKAGFRPLPSQGTVRPRMGRPANSQATGTRTVTSASGTEDLLLHGDIVEALALAFRGSGKPSADAAELARELLKVRQNNGRLGLGPDGVLLFREDGRRQGGTGEHVVHLRPHFQGDRVLPKADIDVWRRGDRDSGGHWELAGRRLLVSYDEYKVHGDRSHGND